MRDLFLSPFGTSLSYATSSETSMVKSYFQKPSSGVLLFNLLGGLNILPTWPTDTTGPLVSIFSDIFSEIFSDIFSKIFSDMFSDIFSDMFSDTYSAVTSRTSRPYQVRRTRDSVR